MAIQQQHKKWYLYVYAALTLIALLTTFLTTAELSGAQPRSVRFEIRVASPELVEGWESVTAPITAATIWISPEASLTNVDVFQAQQDHTNDDKVCVNLLLTEDGALKLARLTKSHIGGLLALMIDGRVMSTPRIMVEIAGGQARLDGNFTEEEAKAIADGITAR